MRIFLPKDFAVQKFGLKSFPTHIHAGQMSILELLQVVWWQPVHKVFILSNISKLISSVCLEI